MTVKVCECGRTYEKSQEKDGGCPQCFAIKPDHILRPELYRLSHYEGDRKRDWRLKSNYNPKDKCACGNLKSKAAKTCLACFQPDNGFVNR